MRVLIPLLISRRNCWAETKFAHGRSLCLGARYLRVSTNGQGARNGANAVICGETRRKRPHAAFIRDVSERSRLQAQLLESERLAAIGTTAANIAHEIANPLNGMYLTVQLLEQRLAKELAGSDGQLTANIKRLKDEIARLIQLLQQFRALARLDKYDFGPLEVAD